MPDCTRCQHPVTRHALTCSHCGNVLKAHGHPGIPLHQAVGEEPLCLSCLYHADDSCNYPKRPGAMDCTLYTQARVAAPMLPRDRPGAVWTMWLRRHSGLVAVLGLLGLSLAIALAR
jgi:hypothetical protein